MDSIVEEQRRTFEEKERLENALVKERMLKKTTFREKINSEHRMKYLLDRCIDCSNNLTVSFNDEDGAREEEVDSMSGSDEFRTFYKHLKKINAHYSENFAPGEEFEDDPMMVEFSNLDKQRQNPPEELQSLVEFTDEEGYGKYLDMHSLHDQYLNLKHLERVDYLRYLESFDQLNEIPKDYKGSDYRRYLENLTEYLSGYLDRVQPLFDQATMLGDVKVEFESKWSSGQFPGWKKDGGTSALSKHSGAYLDLSGFSSKEELMSLGLDRLKSALMALGLKCGGTLEDRALRLFKTKGVPLESLDSSLFSKSRNAPAKDKNDNHKQIAYLEAQVYSYADRLMEQRAATKENVERRLARTADELEEEEGEPEVVESEEEDDESVPYNPKNLPLGHDGKPIPYWLYKLHGLNITYDCEICGGAQYKGPKSFQRHFSEWRHAFGMRCLGIPNTAHFANVTNISDARALWEKLKSSKATDKWQAATEEEFEDTKGNVMSRKMYDDLRRQGIL